MKNNSPKQLQITQLDQLLWLTTPLGKFFKAIKQRPKKITSAPAKAKAYQTRSWVVRIPDSFTSYDPKARGFQTVVEAEDQAQALEIASESNVWEVLDFKVSNFQVFPSNPIEDEIAKRNQ